MRKVLSILLACMMLLSFAAVASAEGEAYTISYGSYTVAKKGNTYVAGSTGTIVDEWCASEQDYTDEVYVEGEREYIVLAVATKTATAGGHFAIDYDETVVKPMYIDFFGAYFVDNVDTKAADEAWLGIPGDVAISEGIDNGSGLALAWSIAGSTTPNDPIVYLQFAFVDGKTSEDLNANSFVFGVADGLTSKASTALAGNFNDLGDACYAVGSNKVDVVTASNANRTYPNSDKPATPAGPTETTWTVADGNASATVVYDAAVTGKTMIAVYDANGTMIGFANGTAAENATSFTISTTYTGTAAKAKVFVWAADNTTTVGAKVWTLAN